MSDMTDANEIVAETKKEFNLMDRLKSRPIRTTEVTVFTDEVLGAKHMELAEKLAAAKVEAADPDSSATDDDYADLAAETKRVANLVAETAITLKLRALPPIVAEAAARTTRKTLGIKGQITADNSAAYSDLYTAQMISDSVETVKDHQTGQTMSGISPEEAQALRDYLPNGEFNKIDVAIGDLSVRSHIATTLSEDADF